MLVQKAIKKPYLTELIVLVIGTPNISTMTSIFMRLFFTIKTLVFFV